MKKTIISAISVFTLVTLAIPAAFAGQHGYSAQEAFDAMLKLEGNWAGEAVTVAAGKSMDEGTKSSAKVSYKNIAAGSTVMATYAEGSPAEMVSMYHMDGKDTLIHTHYCAAKNQPTMKFKPSAEQGAIDFPFSSGTNMDVNKDAHAHHSYFKIIDEDHYESKTENWANGKLASIRYTKMTRQK